jgi:hypothetical protein
MINEELTKQELQVEITKEAISKFESANLLVETILELEIKNNDQYRSCGDLLKQVKLVFKAIDEERKSLTKPIDKIKSWVMDQYKPVLDKLSQVEVIQKKAMLVFQREQERKQIEEERKAIVKANTEEKRKRKIIEERIKKAEEKGNYGKTEALKESAEDIYVPVIVTASKLEKIKGISTIKKWVAKIEDFSKVPAHFYIEDEKVQSAIQALMNRYAVATKGALKVDGVVFDKEEIISSRLR